MTGTAASPIKLDTGDAIAVSNQPENAARSGHNRRMKRPCNATESVAWKREQLRSGKPPSERLTFIVDKPNEECRLRVLPKLINRFAVGAFWLHSNLLKNGRGEKQMKRNRSRYLCGRFAALAFLGSAITCAGALAQETTAGSEDTAVQREAAAMAPAGTRNEITFASWTGPYMRSQMLGFVRPYEEAKRTRVNVEHYAGGIGEIRDQVESANVIWDVVDLTQADSLRACNEGLLENIEDIDLPDGADGTGFREDFVEGALNPCGIGVIVWATIFGYSNNAFGDSPPTSVADFFDTITFAGRRAIRNDPTVIMEWALIADGVAQEDVYSVLETPEGVERALAKMDAIKPGLVLWDKGREPVRLLNNDEVVMTSVWATTGAVASREEGANFSVVWDGRVIELDLFGIPKGSRYKEEAIDFIRFASSSESLANMVGYLPNGPTRRSSLALISDDVLSQLPNGPAYNDKISIHSDAQWWSENQAALEEAFDAWIAGAARQGASGTVR